jgi:hypothetical protein
MKKIFSLQAFFCLVICGQAVYAQSGATITGRVLHGENKPVAAASIVLLRATDSTPVKMAVTNKEGWFILEELATDTFMITVTGIGFNKYTSAPVIVKQTNQQIVLPAVQLALAEAGVLQGVTVTANKPFIEQKTDRTIVHVDALIANAGANALEVLERSPGVIVDMNGNISFKGKPGVLVLIDDKPTYLSAADLAAYLKALPASALDKIELMSNPPARYDAAASAGIINIKTKKSTLKGFNGVASVNAGYGMYGRGGASGNINYRSGKINLFGNLAYNIQKLYRKMDVERRYYTADHELESIFSQTTLFYPERKSATIKAGMDYYLSGKTTWGAVFTGTFSQAPETSPVKSYIYNDNNQLDSMIVADNTRRDQFSSTGFNVNFRHQFDSTHKVWTFDLDYVKYSSASKRLFVNSTYDGNNVVKQVENLGADLPAAIHIYAARTDYDQTLKGGAKIGAGLKSSFVSADNAANYFYITSNTTTIDNERTNRFRYQENINAAYVNFNTSYKRFSFQSGLRLENTHGKGYQSGNALKPDSSFTKSYTQLFPTAYLMYKLDSAGKHTINLNYGRRINRPYYQDLNPFIFLLDKFSYFSGNPYIRPQLANNIELSYHYKNRVTATLVYNYTTDMQMETIEQAGNIFISRTGNIGRLIFMGINVNGSLQPVKWFSANIYTELIRNYFKGPVSTSILNSGAPYWYINANNQFTFNKGWGAEISGFYITKSTSGQFQKNFLWAVNAGVQKKVLNNKGTIRASFRDVFHTLNPAGVITNIPGSTAAYHNTANTQAFVVAFTWNFGKSYKTGNRRNTNSAEDEQNRIKN